MKKKFYYDFEDGKQMSPYLASEFRKFCSDIADLTDRISPNYSKKDYCMNLEDGFKRFVLVIYWSYFE